MNEPGLRYIDEYRDKNLIMRLVRKIKESAAGHYVFMEVCGGHTAAIHRFGIPSLLPRNIKLISGPGCPVCVTDPGFIDRAVTYARNSDFIIATYGDLMRVPGSGSSLEKEKSNGADIRVVFSGLEALEIARSNPGRNVVFLGIGFETTAPGTAVTIKEAINSRIKNFFLLSSHKIMPPAMDAIIREGTKLNGFICPGHVATITGSSCFEFIPEKYGLACVITGFEPVDLLQSVFLLVGQVNSNSPAVVIQYRRAVLKEGNRMAQKIMSEVFEKCDAHWRGLGTIPSSGLRLRQEFERLDAEKMFPVKVLQEEENVLCICGDILRGIKTPDQCSHFSTGCTPENPVGACMVSEEGACNTFYRYCL